MDEGPITKTSLHWKQVCFKAQQMTITMQVPGLSLRVKVWPGTRMRQIVRVKSATDIEVGHAQCYNWWVWLWHVNVRCTYTYAQCCATAGGGCSLHLHKCSILRNCWVWWWDVDVRCTIARNHRIYKVQRYLQHVWPFSVQFLWTISDFSM